MTEAAAQSLAVERDIEVRRLAIEISVGALRRHLLAQTKALAEGGGDLWNARRKANRMLVEVFGQMAGLGVVAAPDLRFGRRKAKENS